MAYISITGMLKELGKSKTKLNANILRYHFRNNLESINGGQYVSVQMFQSEKLFLISAFKDIESDMKAQMTTDLIMDKSESINNFDIRLVELEADNRILESAIRELKIEHAELNFRIEKAEKAISNILEIFYNINQLKGE